MCFKSNPKTITLPSTIALERVRIWRLKKPKQKEPYIYELTIMTADLNDQLRSKVFDEINKIIEEQLQNN